MLKIKNNASSENKLDAFLYVAKFIIYSNTLSILGFTSRGDMSATAVSPAFTSLSVMSIVQWSSPMCPIIGYCLPFTVTVKRSFLNVRLIALRTLAKSCTSSSCVKPKPS